MVALDQLEHYLLYREEWCEHNPSITVYVREHEWLKVGAWVYENFDKLGGVSFLPHSDHAYQQAPYEEITGEQYSELVAAFPQVDWLQFHQFESTDHTTGSQELACTAGACEI